MKDTTGVPWPSAPIHCHTWHMGVWSTHIMALSPTINVHNSRVGWCYFYYYSCLQTRKLRFKELKSLAQSQLVDIRVRV